MRAKKNKRKPKIENRKKWARAKNTDRFQGVVHRLRVRERALDRARVIYDVVRVVPNKASWGAVRRDAVRHVRQDG